MTVEELINELQKLDKNTEVYIESSGNEYSPQSINCIAEHTFEVRIEPSYENQYSKTNKKQIDVIVIS